MGRCSRKTVKKQHLENAREELAEEIDFYKFQQYEFDKQWSQLHAYANEQGIQIVGDIPIYVAFDGADTWASRNYSSLMKRIIRLQ